MTFSADETFHRALLAAQTGKFDDAERLLKQVIESQPDHIPALNVISGFLAGRSRIEEAKRYMALALAAYDRALQRMPSLAEAWFGRGQVLSQLGRNLAAIDSLDRAIANNPTLTHAHLLRAKLLADSGRLEQALEDVDRLLAMVPNLAEGWLGRSNILFELRRHNEALDACERALALNSRLPEAWLGRGNVLVELQHLDDALAAYHKARALNPQLAGALLGRGNVFSKLKRYDDALAAYDAALGLAPNMAEAWLGRGNVLTTLNRHEEASAAFDRVLALFPDFAEAWLGRGNVLFALKRHDAALHAYDKALSVRSTLVEAQLSRGNVFAVQKRHGEAATAYAAVLKMDPDYPFAKGLLLHQRMLSADWAGIDALIEDIEKDIAAGKLAAEPFGWQGVAKSPRSLQLCAELYAGEKYPPHFKTPLSGRPSDHKKVRIGYLSGELREQATSHLIVGVLEHHDASRFEVHGFDNGWDDHSEIRGRIDAAMHKIISIRQLSDAAALAAIREAQIDILVNLNGYFGEHRTSLFAQRAAPIQVNYLGFPGTLGANYMDYIVADRHVIPEDQKEFYDERVVYLPACYQANDGKKRIAIDELNRAKYGLPDSGVVFCCFNNTYKILPEIFDCWMKILLQVEGSVLWLLNSNGKAAANLRREAAARNVNGNRLVFAQIVPLSEHLARHRLADLFLDTLPYNAHTTASDALWAGVPLITSVGQTFPGKVAGSLLRAIRLPELITTNLESYERMAVELGNDPGKLATIKRNLVDQRLTTPLFDSKLFTQRIEKAYDMMYERYQAGLPPDHLYIVD